MSHRPRHRHDTPVPYAGVGLAAEPLANTCGVTSGTQAGAVRSVTGPDPATGAAARRTEFVNDATGRLRGSQVVGGGKWFALHFRRSEPTAHPELPGLGGP